MIRVTVAGAHWLAPAAAASYLRLLAAGIPSGITDAGRTYAEQLALWRKQGHLGLAWHPDDPRANHLKGLALDLPRAAATWLDTAQGRSHGWRRTIAAEWWHFEYFEHLDQHKPTSRKRGPDMVIIKNGTRYRAISGDRLAGIDPGDVPAFAAAGVPVVAVSDETWANFRAGFTPEG